MKLEDLLKNKTYGVHKNLFKYKILNELKECVAVLLKKSDKDISLSLSERYIIIKNISATERVFLQKNSQKISKIFQNNNTPELPIQFH